MILKFILPILGLGQNLRIYVYDASYGLAETIAPVFLDQKISAIYHTSVVMCGKGMTQ